jgi:hypothetical protein
MDKPGTTLILVGDNKFSGFKHSQLILPVQEVQQICSYAEYK